MIEIQMHSRVPLQRGPILYTVKVPAVTEALHKL